MATTQSSSSVLTTALRQLLRPLVRVLLRQGIAFDSVSEVLKQAYVDVAEKEFGLPGKKQTVSRISTITGLTRKEVARIQQLEVLDLNSLNQQFNRAARVISGWITDAAFLDNKQQPLPLSLDAGSHSFNDLVKRYSGDIPPGAIADELLRVGAIEQTSDGKVKLIQHAYVPQHDVDEKLKILGIDVSDLIQTIDHNINHQEQPRFQRKVCYNAIPDELLVELKQKLSALAQASLEQMNEVMREYDTDSNEQLDAETENKRRAGIGIYYFEDED